MKLGKTVFLFLLVQSATAWNGDSALMSWSNTGHLPFTVRRDSLFRIIAVMQQQNDRHSLPNAYRRLGSLYRKHGALDSAVQSYISSIREAEQVQDTFSLASSYNQLARTYYELADYRSAESWFLQAYRNYGFVATAYDRNKGMADAGVNLAETYYWLHEPMKALDYCRLSMQHRRDNQDTADIGYNYDLLAMIYAALHYPTLSKDAAEKAIRLFRQNEDLDGLVPALIHYGSCFEQGRQYDAALRCYREAYAIALQRDQREQQVESALRLANAFTQLKNTDSAFYYMQVYTTGKEHLFAEWKVKATINAATQFDSERKTLENERQQEEIRNQRVVITASLFSLAALGVIVVLLTWNMYNRRRIGKKQMELNRMNAMLQGQDEERERIARELHDRVGSMLSTVKVHFSNLEDSMDTLKKHADSYTEAVHLLDETCEEVRRISHDLNSGLLAKFGMRTALLQLISVIESGNKVRVAYIDNDLDPDAYRDVETELYRITQELLNNTLKHAGASEITIQLNKRADHFVYSYEDDGKGFDKAIIGSVKGIGYRNIDSRVKKTGGTWHLDTQPGKGLTVIIEIPLYAAHTGTDRR